MAYETKGIIKRIGPIEVKSEKFSKRTLVLDVEDGRFPQVVEFQATGDRCALLDQFNEGEEVNIFWNLRGREWSGGTGGVRVFNSCDIWKVDRIGEKRTAQAPSGTDDQIPF